MRLLNPIGILSVDVATGGLVWVDQVNGSDALASRGRMTIPFQTLSAAKVAAKSGDTIMVLPGSYAENNLLKEGVNWHFLPGAKVTFSGSSAGAIFDTSSYGTNGAVNSVITGHGEFNVSAATDSAHIVHSAAAGSSLLVQARSFSSVDTAIKITASSGRCVVDVLEDIIAGSADTILQNGTGTENYVKARLLRTSGGAALSVGAGSIDVTAYRLSSSADSAVRITGGTGQITVRAYEIIAETKSGVYYNASTGPNLTILGSRIVSLGSVAADGRAVRIDTSSSYKVRLGGCVLVGSSAATESISGPVGGVYVIIVGGAVGNKTVANVTPVGNDWQYNSNIT